MNSRDGHAEPFFLSAESGQLFALWHAPKVRPARALLHVPAFGEEMNKSRRMVALFAQTLRSHGTGTLLVDLYGTGDSQGDLEEVTLARWQQDLRCSVAWLRAQGVTEVILWGHRLGALLAASVLADSDGIQRMLLWNPVTSGSRFVTQFLRLRTANSLMQGGKETVKQLREKLQIDGVLEVAGCVLPQTLVHSLETLKLVDLPPAASLATAWFDVHPDADAALTAASVNIIEHWQGAGVAIQAKVVPGEQFWSTQEISLAPALLDASLAFVESTCPSTVAFDSSDGKVRAEDP